jgi:hypothetical protein
MNHGAVTAKSGLSDHWIAQVPELPLDRRVAGPDQRLTTGQADDSVTGSRQFSSDMTADETAGASHQHGPIVRVDQ